VQPRRIILTARFGKALGALTANEKAMVKKAISHFINRTAEHAIRARPKHGSDCWAFRVPGTGIRIFYDPKSDDEGRVSELFHVGHHDEYRTIKRKG
jgi:hypothetical protein